MKRYTLGLQGMAESEHGEYIRVNDHIDEIKEYDALNERNRNLAETLLKEQDAEIEKKNKEIFKLKQEIADLNAEIINRTEVN